MRGHLKTVGFSKNRRNLCRIILLLQMARKVSQKGLKIRALFWRGNSVGKFAWCLLDSIHWFPVDTQDLLKRTFYYADFGGKEHTLHTLHTIEIYWMIQFECRWKAEQQTIWRALLNSGWLFRVASSFLLLSSEANAQLPGSNMQMGWWEWAGENWDGERKLARTEPVATELTTGKSELVRVNLLEWTRPNWWNRADKSWRDRAHRATRRTARRPLASTNLIYKKVEAKLL